MKNLISILLILLCSNAFAQDYKIGIYGGPSYNLIRTKLVTTTDPLVGGTASADPLIGYTIGVRGSYSFNEKFAIGTGLGFTNIIYGRDKYELFFGSPEPDGPTHAGFADRYFFLDLPINAIFRINKYFATTAGIEANVLVGNRSSFTYFYRGGRTQTVNESSSIGDFRPANMSLMLGVEVDFPINERLEIFAQPSFKYMLFSLNENLPINRNATTIWLAVGLNYKLTKEG